MYFLINVFRVVALLVNQNLMKNLIEKDEEEEEMRNKMTEEGDEEEEEEVERIKTKKKN